MFLTPKLFSHGIVFSSVFIVCDWSSGQWVAYIQWLGLIAV